MFRLVFSAMLLAFLPSSVSAQSAPVYWGASNAVTPYRFCLDEMVNYEQSMACRDKVRGHKFQARIIRFCSAVPVNSAEALECVEKFADKYYTNKDIDFCVEAGVNSRQTMSCLESAEHTVIPDESIVELVTTDKQTTMQSSWNDMIVKAKDWCKRYWFYVIIDENWRERDCSRTNEGSFICTTAIRCTNIQP